MGSGRGKGCFWLSHFTGCKVVGVEWIPQFVWLSRVVKFLFCMKRVSFQKIDMEHFELSGATLIYLYGNFPKLHIPKGVKVLTISEPLEGLSVIKTFWVRYPWGRTAAYLQV